MSQHDTLTQQNLNHIHDLVAVEDEARAALSATQPVQAAQGEPAEIMQMVDTLIASMNEAHCANSEGWRDACFQSADRVREKIKDAVTALTEQQAAQGEPIMSLGETLSQDQLDELWGRYPEVRAYLKDKAVIKSQQAVWGEPVQGDRPDASSHEAA